MFRVFSGVSLLATCATVCGYPAPADVFPIIDLGYAAHAPTKINRTSVHGISYATYANIRFAQPPIGDLRFRAPQIPPPPSHGVQDGVVPFNSTNCLQAIPSYFTFLPGFNGSSWGSEDCLFLDVIVPEGIKEGNSVPVLHWIYGGGYFYGAKDNGGNPAALFDGMSEDEKFIIVASNYRLGALGWMSSEEESSIAPNAGLYDALTALEWTRDNIYRFGGDRYQVSIMGQSAGGGIIEHLLAASRRGVDVTFSQAILSSPGYRPHVNRSRELTELYRMFLDLTDCSDVKCLRGVNSGRIAEANRYLFINAETDGFPGPLISFGPVIDNDLVKDVPFRALENDKTPMLPGHVKRVIAGGMKNDGAASTIGNFTTWKELLSIFARTPTASTINDLLSLYGEFDGSVTSFKPDGSVNATPFDKFSGDIIFACNDQIAAKAYSENQKNDSARSCPPLSSSSYRYEMSIPPALHGQDLSYYFFDKIVAAADPTIQPQVAMQFQRYLRQFILGQDLEDWPEYSSKGLGNPSWMNITAHGFQPVEGMDEAELSKKCESIVQLLSHKADGW